MQPILYKSGTNDFGNLGLGIIPDAFDDSIHEIKNGSYTANFSIPKSSRFFNAIENEMLVKLKPNAVDEFDIFKVIKVDKQTDSDRAIVTLGHKTDDSNNYFVKDLSVDGRSPKDILLSLTLDRNSPFSFESDITQTINNTNVTYKIKNPNQIILGESNSLQKITGGLVRKRLNTISLLKNDSPRSMRLRSGKNINGLNVIKSLDGLVTRMIPYIIIHGKDKSPDVTTFGQPVLSPNVNKYSEQYTTYVDYSSRADNASDMNDLASRYFTENKGIDEPNYDVQVDVYDYGSKIKEAVQCGDIAKLYDPEFDLNIDLEIYDVSYSSIMEDYQSIKAGTQAVDLFHNLESRIKETQDNVDNSLNDMNNNINDNFDDMNSTLDDTLGELDEKLDKNKQEVDNKLTSQEEQVRQYVQKIQQTVNNVRDDLTSKIQNKAEKINYGGTAITASNLSFGADGLIYTGGGRTKVAIGADGRVYADSLATNELTGTRINGGEIVGGSVTGDVYISSGYGDDAAVMSKYGFTYMGNKISTNGGTFVSVKSENSITGWGDLDISGETTLRGHVEMLGTVNFRSNVWIDGTLNGHKP